MSFNEERSFNFSHLLEMSLLSHNKAPGVGVYMDILSSSIYLSIYSREDQFFVHEGDQSMLPQNMALWYKDCPERKAISSSALPLSL